MYTADLPHKLGNVKEALETHLSSTKPNATYKNAPEAKEYAVAILISHVYPILIVILLVLIFIVINSLRKHAKKTSDQELPAKQVEAAINTEIIPNNHQPLNAVNFRWDKDVRLLAKILSCSEHDFDPLELYLLLENWDGMLYDALITYNMFFCCKFSIEINKVHEISKKTADLDVLNRIEINLLLTILKCDAHIFNANGLFQILENWEGALHDALLAYKKLFCCL